MLHKYKVIVSAENKTEVRQNWSGLPIHSIKKMREVPGVNETPGLVDHHPKPIWDHLSALMVLCC